MIISSIGSLHEPYLDRAETAFVSEVAAKRVSNMSDREIVLRQAGGLSSLNNALEFKVIDWTSNAGSTLRTGKLIAAVAAHRMATRLNEKLLGTRKSMKLMVYEVSGVKTRGRGFVTTGGINADFFSPLAVGKEIANRIDAGSAEVRVFAVDEAIESMMDRFKEGGGIIV